MLSEAAKSIEQSSNGDQSSGFTNVVVVLTYRKL
jgi:hypothetical protein